MHSDDFPVLASSPAGVVAALAGRASRVLLLGQAGTGKSTLVQGLAGVWAAEGRPVWCIGADPGTPFFGVPGAICLGHWSGGRWEVKRLEALCTLDAARFRLPLVSAVGRLAGMAGGGVLLVDSPGVVRGAAGAELLAGLVEAAGVDAVLVLARDAGQPPLAPELRALALPVWVIRAAAGACRPGKAARARARTGAWDRYLGNTREYAFDSARLRIVGTPPPLDVPAAWDGRQVALLEAGTTLRMGEVLKLKNATLHIKLPASSRGPADPPAPVLLVRDAARQADGRLGTAAPFAADRAAYLPPPDMLPPAAGAEGGGPRFAGRVGALDVSLVNGVFGDPLLHLRLRHQRRSLLFDLGAGARLPARLAHQVSDVFISHAHVDHIGGFLWLLRSRIGAYPLCRVYGPPGLAENIEGLVRGILWDRVGDRGPRFQVTELQGERLRRFLVQGGRPGPHPLGEEPAPDGVLRHEPGFRVRATGLYHVSTVLAFALEPAAQINVRKDRLLARGLEPGPWLGELKQRVSARQGDSALQLPDGRVARVAHLADDLLHLAPGKKLVYATDLADTAENRRRLVDLARNAHTFICEASFREKDAARADSTAHLTTRACAEIAQAAGVARLVPFHFSRRYEDDPASVYQEVADIFSRAVIPGGGQAGGASATSTSQP